MWSHSQVWTLPRCTSIVSPMRRSSPTAALRSRSIAPRTARPSGGRLATRPPGRQSRRSSAMSDSAYPIISADSHVTEPPETYVDHIDRAWRDKAPRLEHHETLGDVFLIDGMKNPLALGTVAAAGKPAEQIYPTVGMVLCNHRDWDYKKACFDAYNRWLAAYSGAHPERLIGIGQTAMRSPEEGIADLKSIKSLGLRGVMMPGVPAVEDYDSPVYDDFWRASIDLGLPLSFHILTTRDARPRGPLMNSFLSVIRGCQDIMGM